MTVEVIPIVFGHTGVVSANKRCEVPDTIIIDFQKSPFEILDPTVDLQQISGYCECSFTTTLELYIHAHFAVNTNYSLA